MQLDVRGPRFAAAITTGVLIAVLVTGSGWLALAQAVVFAISAASARLAPYGVIYRALIAPRLGRATAFEPAEPVRFAQAVGFAFAATAAVAYLGGAPVVGVVATSAALVAAFLNAAFGLCLGCEAYLLIRRVGARARVEPSPTHNRAPWAPARRPDRVIFVSETRQHCFGSAGHDRWRGGRVPGL